MTTGSRRANDLARTQKEKMSHTQTNTMDAHGRGKWVDEEHTQLLPKDDEVKNEQTLKRTQMKEANRWTKAHTPVRTHGRTLQLVMMTMMKQSFTDDRKQEGERLDETWKIPESDDGPEAGARVKPTTRAGVRQVKTVEEDRLESGECWTTGDDDDDGRRKAGKIERRTNRMGQDVMRTRNGKNAKKQAKAALLR